jgi:leader peptidase (prepilin peptidase)/N-methyltransferase
VELYWYFAGAIFLLGLVLGSFLNVCIYRLPRNLSVSSPARSFCPNCHAQISAFDNIPVLSWMLLGGKCRNCKQPISARYAVIELFTGLLFVACYLRFGGVTAETVKWAVFCFLILGLIFTDLETRLLPDVMTIPGILFGLVFAALIPMRGYLEARYAMQSTFSNALHGPRFLSVADSALAAAIGAGVLYAVAELYFRMRGFEGMGFGDVKLVALIGAFAGIRLLVFVLFMASLTGAIYGFAVLLSIYLRRRRRYAKIPESGGRAWRSAQKAMRLVEIPFGVFLGGMSLLAVFYGNPLMRWYFGLFFSMH